MDEEFLKRAIKKAEESAIQGGFPAGAVIVKDGKIIGEGLSIGNRLNDPTNHGEIAAIRDACDKLQTSNLSGAVLYTSMQSCLMCLGATSWAGITKIIYACSKDKVSDEYYGGHYNPSAINSELTHPIELMHFPALESESLAVVHEWEQSQ